jgi:predicted  nucleic acid-binding Zn-ribbon protein
VEAWTDERMDDLAAALRPLPAQMARNTEAIERLSEEIREIRGEFREIREEMRGDRQSFREEMREMRTEMHAGFASLQRQLTLIGWSMAFSVIGATVAVIIGT